ncbi:MAG: hypothetical protein A2Z04_07210 [Chloroflexi bacterium RBG_16_57_9]|nr:MAG: hypothetical protein A2Z04_07210 [Chloroflexi bacterium RBG_16_57_9]
MGVLQLEGDECLLSRVFLSQEAFLLPDTLPGGITRWFTKVKAPLAAGGEWAAAVRTRMRRGGGSVHKSGGVEGGESVLQKSPDLRIVAAQHLSRQEVTPQ